MKRKRREELAAYFEAPKPERKQVFVRQFILRNENICQTRCITSEHFGKVEQKAVNEYAHEYKLSKMNLWHVIVMQARYVSKWVWILSALFFGAAFVTAQTAEQRYVDEILGFVPFLVMFSVTESTRSYRYGMEELELSARFSLKSIIMARMVVLGLGNLAALTGAILVLGSRVQMNPVYMMTPYFVTAGGGLYIVRKVRGKESDLLCFGLAAFVCAAALYLPWQFPGIYLPQNVWIWACVCGAGLVLTIWESLNTIWRTEELTWN